MGFTRLNAVYGTVATQSNSASTSVVLGSGQGAAFASASSTSPIRCAVIDTTTNPETLKFFLNVTGRSTDTLTVANRGVTDGNVSSADANILVGYVLAAVTSVGVLDGTYPQRLGGTSTVSAPVPFYNVKDYGAVGDSNGTTGNGTDDTTAINAAITACAATGGEVFFPVGTYRITTAAISITASNVRLRGAVRNGCRLFFDTTDNTSFGGVLFDGGASAGTITGVSLRDLTVFNRSGITPPATGNLGWDGAACRVTFRGCAQFLCDNVEVYNAPNYGMVTIRCTSGTISNCYSHDNQADGIHVFGGGQISVVNNHIANTNDDGIGVSGGDLAQGTITDLTIANNTIYQVGSRGIAILAPTINVVATGNTIDSTVGHGISVEVENSGGPTGFGDGDISGVIITGNTIANAGLYSAAGARGSSTSPPAAAINIAQSNRHIYGVVVANNQVTSCRNSFVDTGRSATSNGLIHELVVTGNQFRGVQFADASDSHYPGIRIKSCVGAKVSDNTIFATYHEGVLADSGNQGTVSVQNNTFRKINLNATSYATKNGLTISSGVPVVSGNVIEGSILAATESLTAAALDVNNVADHPGTAAGHYTYASDTMTKANGTLAGTSGQAGPAWAALTGQTSHSISSNAAVAPVNNTQYGTVVDLGQYQEQYVEANITLSATANRANNQVVLGSSANGQNQVKVGIYNNAGTLYWLLYIVVGNSGTILDQATLASWTGSSTHKIAGRLTYTGGASGLSTIHAIIDGAVVSAKNLTATQTAAVKNTLVGISSFTSSTTDDGTVKFTNFLATN